MNSHNKKLVDLKHNKTVAPILNRKFPKVLKKHSISNLLNTRESMDLNKFPNYMPLDHTMVFSLNEYVRQKLPVELFKKALIKKWNIEIHGVYPDIFMKYYKCLGFDLIENISFSNTSPNKRYNYIRPKFFVGYKSRL